VSTKQTEIEINKNPKVHHMEINKNKSDAYGAPKKQKFFFFLEKRHSFVCALVLGLISAL